MRAATLRQLRAFTLVARHHSFKLAAAELHLTPAAVSLQIRDLELAAGMTLFQRHTAMLALTLAGELLLADVQLALQALQHAGDTLAGMRRCSSDPVRVGMVSSAKYFLPRLIAQFRAQHAEVSLQLTVGNRECLVEQLGRADIDLAIMGSPPEELALRALPFAEQPLGVIAAPEHPLAHAGAVPPGELAQHEFIVREPGSGTRAALERFLKAQNIELPLVREVTGNAAAKQAVMANLGLAFISLHAVALELQGGLLVSVDVQGLPLRRHWYVVEAGTSPRNEPAQALSKFIVERGTDGSVLATCMSTDAAAALP
jgi:DNA-binding transcriptional LysR family regulator